MKDYLITTDFTGGNCKVLEMRNGFIRLEPELRDTQTDWFYWAFCVEGAQGRTVTFDFGSKEWIGPFGPAVSHDLQNWHWLDGNSSGSRFTYSFSSQEERVYFAHSMLYLPDRFFAFAKLHGLKVQELCVSEHGSSVPCLSLGEGAVNAVLTARHHCCESTGSYVLEGVLDAFIKNPIPDVTLFCVPFVDYDGVLRGDQGKNRRPHDHNRDYVRGEAAFYPSVAKIREYIDTHKVLFGFDFHSPYHAVDEYVFQVQKSWNRLDRLQQFGSLLTECITSDSLQYDPTHDLRPDTGWNTVGTPTSSTYLLESNEECVAFSLETPYFGSRKDRFTQQKAVALGRCFTKAFRRYLS